MSDPIFSIVKDEEQELRSKIPSFLSKEQKVTPPTSFLKDYVATGDPVFKKAAGRSLDFLRKLVKGDTVEYTRPKELDEKIGDDNITNDILHRENRGAAANGENLYEVIGVTGDLGKYQVKPQTLKDWSKAWLGKEYTLQEFIHDPEAQEKFFKEFINLTKRYKLNREDTLVAWHGGWGLAGTGEGTREEREVRLKNWINKKKQDPEMQAYLKGE